MKPIKYKVSTCHRNNVSRLLMLKITPLPFAEPNSVPRFNAKNGQKFIKRYKRGINQAEEIQTKKTDKI